MTRCWLWGASRPQGRLHASALPAAIHPQGSGTRTLPDTWRRDPPPGRDALPRPPTRTHPAVTMRVNAKTLTRSPGAREPLQNNRGSREGFGGHVGILDTVRFHRRLKLSATNLRTATVETNLENQGPLFPLPAGHTGVWGKDWLLLPGAQSPIRTHTRIPPARARGRKPLVRGRGRPTSARPGAHPGPWRFWEGERPVTSARGSMLTDHIS